MKKILYITTGIQGSGGVSRILSVKLNYLLNYYNYEIVVINSNYIKAPFFYDFSKSIKFYHIQHDTFFSFKNKVLEVVERENPNVVVNCDNGLKGTLLTYFFKKNIPIVYERHCGKYINSSGIIDFLKLKLSNVLLDRIIMRYRLFVVLNKQEKQTWQGSNLEVIPNPLWFDPPLKVNKLESRFVVAVGRQSVEKRYDKLLRIWKDVVKQYPDWILKIYGEKNEKLKLDELVSKLKLKDNVKFFDPVSNVEEIYTQASMLLTTSESEAFGLVLLEAMAHSIPVVAFNGTSGTDMLIQDNINGFLVEKNDFNMFIEKVCFLINDKDSKKLLGNRAKSFAKEFEIKSIMQQWDNLFQSIS
ncbi:glycosyltransferase [Aestuariibaculum suncheonense]|uniref:Glycosyltransferase n=1 Tax=Aestuariibaculum suncheonense TaxID=1028745 RepID=A0A8J6QD19_9FLAO|nr:glycosyltransferase [Aestuariibaculum suncheonense]MBD0834507.1 glycosyltransferase [Aestuariibaculum suncheonense]